ncbi:diacylglycerol kinase family protein [candidate division KSB1 bacterium]|nr:diacylglycerol kinase family protein [candidate division KSB1 bacterium]
MSFNRRKFVRSFIYAARGLRVLAGQQNARFHLFAAAAVVVVGVLLDLGRMDWLWIFAAIALVLMAEAFNTAIEKLADTISSQYHPHIEHAKDVAAAAVLIAAIGAAIIGLLIFYPYLIE